MNRSVLVYALLLVAALVGAYWSWNHEPTTRESQSVEIARFEPNEIESFTYETDKKKVSVSFEDDQRGRYGWVEYTQFARQSKEEEAEKKPTDPQQISDGPDATAGDTGDTADASGDTADAEGDVSVREADVDRREQRTGRKDAAAERAAKTADDRAENGDASDGTDREVETFKASSALDRFLEDLNPMQAARRLPAKRRKAEKLYGFDAPLGTLTIETSNDERTFTIGKYAYGRRHLYVRDERSGDYYVLDAGVISPLKFADTRLREQRVLGVSERELKRVVVHSGERSTTIVHHNIDDPRAAFWSIGAESDEESRPANSWVSKLIRVEIARYLSDEQPSGTELAAVVEVLPRDGTKNEIRLFKTSGSDAQSHYYAVSDFTRKYVELRASRASSLLADLDTIFEPGKHSTKDGSGSANEPGRSPRPTEKGAPGK